MLRASLTESDSDHTARLDTYINSINLSKANWRASASLLMYRESLRTGKLGGAQAVGMVPPDGLYLLQQISPNQPGQVFAL